MHLGSPFAEEDQQQNVEEITITIVMKDQKITLANVYNPLATQSGQSKSGQLKSGEPIIYSFIFRNLLRLTNTNPYPNPNSNPLGCPDFVRTPSRVPPVLPSVSSI